MLYRAPAVLLALTMHELAHGYIALKCGDTTARDRGRLTLNPLKHLDLVGTLSMFILSIGWAKPVPVNPLNFRNGRRDDLKVSLAGVTTNFILFLFATLVTIFLSRALYTPNALNLWGREYFLNFQYKGFNYQLLPEYYDRIFPSLQTPWLLHIQRFFLQLAYVNIGMGLFNLLPMANDIVFRGKINLSGTAFRVTHLLLLVLLFSSNFIGKWISGAIYAVQGAILPLLLALIPV
jgi:Zn-dependent protease